MVASPVHPRPKGFEVQGNQLRQQYPTSWRTTVALGRDRCTKRPTPPTTATVALLCTSTQGGARKATYNRPPPRKTHAVGANAASAGVISSGETGVAGNGTAGPRGAPMGNGVRRLAPGTGDSGSQSAGTKE